VMALLVEAAVVDGRVDPRERALLLVAAAALGIDATAVEERITRRLMRVQLD
jgi:tellurite resistance protein